MASIALATSSSVRGLPWARPTFENATLHSSSPDAFALLSVTTSVDEEYASASESY
jgi:hypothetical protein